MRLVSNIGVYAYIWNHLFLFGPQKRQGFTYRSMRLYAGEYVNLCVLNSNLSDNILYLVTFTFKLAKHKMDNLTAKNTFDSSKLKSVFTFS